MSDKVYYRRQSTGTLSTSGDNNYVRSDANLLYEGIVDEVILDHKSKYYSRVDGYNVGAIRVRILDEHQNLVREKLPWADPLDNTLYEMPLKGELVTLFKIRDNFFYTKKIPAARRLQENAWLNLNEALENRATNTVANAAKNGDDASTRGHTFGNYFKPDSRVRQLKHFEGDSILQGRMGHSIRFGSSAMDPGSDGLAPNILLRAGQGKNIENDAVSIDSVFGLILEDINKDASSIWMVSDQTIPFQPITLNAGSFYRSILNPPNKFDKASITLNSDRIVMNAKKTHLMLFSNEEIYLNSFKRTSIDSNEHIILTANLNIELKTSGYIENVSDTDFTVRAAKDISLIGVEKNSLVSRKNYIGSVDSDVEPIVGGTSLAIFLARLINVLMGPGIAPPQIRYQDVGGLAPTSVPAPPAPGPANFAHVITPVGPGLLNPTILAGLQALYTELLPPNPGSKAPIPFSGAVFNSNDNFVKLANEDPEPTFVLNEFEDGEQIETENNEWILSDPYYKVL